MTFTVAEAATVTRTSLKFMHENLTAQEYFNGPRVSIQLYPSR